MAIYISGVDITEGIVVTTVLLAVIAVFYSFERKNGLLVRLVAMGLKPRRAELKKDTTKQDWLILVIMLVLVTMLGIKLVILTVVVSDSMKPEFQRGDIILTQSIDKVPKVGDIITFNVQDERTAVSHRVVGITNKGLIKTRGDNNGYIDDYQTTQKNVIAKAIIFDGHPIVIKGLGSLFITDYKGEGVIFKWGDRFTFMQQLSATIRAWGFVITAVAIITYLIMMFGGRRWTHY